MSEENNNTVEMINFLKAEICPLTDSKCEESIDSFNKHKSNVRLITDVFNGLVKCKSDKCKINEPIIKKKLKEFIEKKHGDKLGQL